MSKKSQLKPRAIISRIDCWCRYDEEKSLNDLKPHPRNPNTHPKKQIALLSKIIKEQGWRQPIIVSTRSGFIVKGHGRLAAAKELSLETAPVEYQEYSSDAAEYADLIADNRIAELAEIDKDALDELLDDEAFNGFDLELTGFLPEETEDHKPILKDIDNIQPPPSKTWFLVGIDTIFAHEINDEIERISKNNRTIVESSVSS